jgi:hypothetical protein
VTLAELTRAQVQQILTALERQQAALERLQSLNDDVRKLLLESAVAIERLRELVVKGE